MSGHEGEILIIQAHAECTWFGRTFVWRKENPPVLIETQFRVQNALIPDVGSEVLPWDHCRLVG